MKNTMIALVFASGAILGWFAREPRPTGVLDATDDIVIQHPQQNLFGSGSVKTRIRLYSAGDDDLGPMPECASNDTLWIVTINGTNYRGVAQQ